MGLNPENLKLFEILHPYAANRISEYRASKKRFVHYSTADSAMKILSSSKMWMRKSVIMNDFMEVEHGIQCWDFAWSSSAGDRLRSALNTIHPRLVPQLARDRNDFEPHLRNYTHITCISEHDDDEDNFGRLSMWRAYGGPNGVAMVLNPQVFFQPSDALAAYTSPVAYMMPNEIAMEMDGVASSIEQNAEWLRSRDLSLVEFQLREMMLAAALCTKHPGFKEEREWRIIYSPTLRASKRIRPQVETIHGIPQVVHVIPLQNVPDEDLYGADIRELLNRIIIGPTAYPLAMAEAFDAMLRAQKFTSPEEMISVSTIPLRQS